ncbi:transposase [Streptomyces sp. NPDC006711]|uniref:transposase n=1 Tax=Streptomyces sp. NPDC006711 TaxID=3364762 RepID=UPI0036A79DC5
MIARARGDLTDTQWTRLEPSLPVGKKPGRPPIWTRRQLIDGIRFRTRTGVPWRDMREQYGPWALSAGVRPVPLPAAGRHLAADLQRVAGPGSPSSRTLTVWDARAAA